jgi:mitochondrial fission protein ELM1
VLQPPRPDLVITAGRRNEPVARWIRKQSGGVTRLVHVGRPWASLDCFDLIVTTPQYFVPARENVLINDLPLHSLTRQRLDEAAVAWSERLAHLQRPYIAVLLGGDSGPFVFSEAKGRWLGEQVNALARASGGSLLVTDSARTPTAFFTAFESQLNVPQSVYRWKLKRRENPYLAFIGLADCLVVSGESMSMLAEASVAQKPVYIFDPDDDSAHGCHNPRPWWLRPHSFRYKPLTHRMAMGLGPRRMRRDVARIQQALVNSGRAVWLGQQAYTRQPDLSPPQDLPRAVERVRALFNQGG